MPPSRDGYGIGRAEYRRKEKPVKPLKRQPKLTKLEDFLEMARKRAKGRQAPREFKPLKPEPERRRRPMARAAGRRWS